MYGNLRGPFLVYLAASLDILFRIYEVHSDGISQTFGFYG